MGDLFVWSEFIENVQIEMTIDFFWKKAYEKRSCESRKKEPQHLWCRVGKGEKVFQER